MGREYGPSDASLVGGGTQFQKWPSLSGLRTGRTHDYLVLVEGSMQKAQEQSQFHALSHTVPHAHTQLYTHLLTLIDMTHSYSHTHIYTRRFSVNLALTSFHSFIH
jgi:hypothetical protein